MKNIKSIVFKLIICVWLALCLLDSYTSYILQAGVKGSGYGEANLLVAPLVDIWGAGVFIGLAIVATGVAVVAWRWNNKLLLIALGILVIPELDVVISNLNIMARLT